MNDHHSCSWRMKTGKMFVLFETNTESEVCVRERHFHWWARDREVAREPESECRAFLPCPMAHARRHARAVPRASCATEARTAKSFRALKSDGFRRGFRQRFARQDHDHGAVLPRARVGRNYSNRCCDAHTRTPRYYHGTIIYPTLNTHRFARSSPFGALNGKVADSERRNIAKIALVN